jgi:hypothetical protein
VKNNSSQSLSHPNPQILNMFISIAGFGDVSVKNSEMSKLPFGLLWLGQCIGECLSWKEGINVWESGESRQRVDWCGHKAVKVGISRSSEM